ncbi:hypothetical protein ACFX13_033168 [Malus domestica]
MECWEVRQGEEWRLKTKVAEGAREEQILSHQDHHSYAQLCGWKGTHEAEEPVWREPNTLYYNLNEIVTPRVAVLQMNMTTVLLCIMVKGKNKKYLTCSEDP